MSDWDFLGYLYIYLLSSGMPRLVSPETEVWPCCHSNLAALRGFVKQSTPQVAQPTVAVAGMDSDSKAWKSWSLPSNLSASRLRKSDVDPGQSHPV